MRLLFLIGLFLFLPINSWAADTTSKIEKEAQKIYKKTLVRENENPQSRNLVGPKILLGSYGYSRVWFLRSLLIKGEPERHQLFILNQKIKASSNIVTVNNKDLTFYQTSEIQMVADYDILNSRKKVATVIDIPATLILNSYEENKALVFKFPNRVGKSLSRKTYELSIHAGYLKGYIKKAQDTLGLFKESVP